MKVYDYGLPLPPGNIKYKNGNSHNIKIFQTTITGEQTYVMECDESQANILKVLIFTYTYKYSFKNITRVIHIQRGRDWLEI